MFTDEDRFFNFDADGEENYPEIYAYVLIFDENNKDCLAEDSPNKTKIIVFFSNGIQNLPKNDNFYQE